MSIADRMAWYPPASPAPEASARVPPEQADRLADLVCRLASAGGLPPSREPLTESIRRWSSRTASMASALLHKDIEGLAAMRAVIMVTFDDHDSEALIQALCLEPEVCERTVSMCRNWLLLEDYGEDEQDEALIDAMSRTADLLIEGLKKVGEDDSSVAVTPLAARAAMLQLLWEVLYLDPDGDPRATIEEVAALSPEAFDRLTRALWPIRVAQADSLYLSLSEMEYVARLHAQSPAIALQAAEFFRGREEVDSAAFMEYLRNGTALAEGVL